MKLFNFIKEKTKKLFAITAILALAVQFALPGLAKASGPEFAAEKKLLRGMNITKNQQDWTDPVTGNPGDEFRGIVYIHNNVVNTTATNTTVKVTIPSATVNNSAVIAATVSASNAASISDTLRMNLTGYADISFIPGTVKLFAVDAQKNPVQISFPSGNGDAVVSPAGVSIGNIQGCFQFVHYVSFGFKTRARVVPNQPNLHVTKLVRDVSTGESNFVSADQGFAGDTLEYKINFSNTSEAEALNVLLKDVIPPHTKFVNGSVVISRNGGPEASLANGDNLVGNGITLDRIEPRENSYVKFRVTIDLNTPVNSVLVNTAFLNNLSATAQTTILTVGTPVTPVITTTTTVTPAAAAKPLPVTGPVETASVIVSSLIMGAYGFIRYRKYMASKEVQIINQLLSE